MRSLHAPCLIAMAAILLNLSCAKLARAETDAEVLDRASKDLTAGNSTQALTLVEGVLAHAPQNANALYQSALINFGIGNVDAARGRLERLIRLSGNYFAVWELMVQVTQEQGDLARRNEAFDRLKISAATALDPAIRARVDFIRERIRVGDNAVTVIDFFGRAGTNFTRYQFALGDPRMDPGHGLLLRTDEATTETWRETALLAQDKRLFHLDLVDSKPEGGDNVAIYQYYVGEPDYDTVRADAMKIMRGEMRPSSGQPGSLAGILKR
jgi:tetratricopeptide (TPR) repeat protein